MKLTKEHQIVERLKKRIEEIEKDLEPYEPLNGGLEDVLDELQEILEGKE